MPLSHPAILDLKQERWGTKTQTSRHGVMGQRQKQLRSQEWGDRVGTQPYLGAGEVIRNAFPEYGTPELRAVLLQLLQRFLFL